MRVNSTLVLAIEALLAMGVAACGRPRQSTTTDAGVAASSSTLASTPSIAASATAAVDPQMAELTKDLRGCVSRDPLLWDCPALPAFESSKDPYFDTDTADNALIDMLTGTDARLALIATKRDGRDPRRALSDVARAERLLDVIERPNTVLVVKEAAARWLSYADFEKLGLGERVRNLAKQPDP